MTIHTTPSFVDRCKARAWAAHTRLMGKPKVVNIARQPIKQFQQPIRAGFKPPIAQFVQEMCERYGFILEDIHSRNKAGGLREARVAIIRATDAAYPGVSLQRLMALFNRKESMIINTLGRNGNYQEKQAQREIRDAEARKLYDEGLTYEEIAEKIDLCRGSVKHIKKVRGWPARKMPKKTARGE